MLSQDFRLPHGHMVKAMQNNAHTKETHSELENILHSLLIKGMQIK